jgi:hypothetical protein
MNARPINGVRIGQVLGVIGSEWHGDIHKNLARLAEYTRIIRTSVPFSIFLAAEIFTPELIARLPRQTQAEWDEYWRAVHSSYYITDFFLTPRWKRSSDTLEALKTAKRQGIRVHMPYGYICPILLSHILRPGMV